MRKRGTITMKLVSLHGNRTWAVYVGSDLKGLRPTLRRAINLAGRVAKQEGFE